MLFKKAKTKHQERIDKKEKEALRKAVAAFNMQREFEPHHAEALQNYNNILRFQKNITFPL